MENQASKKLKNAEGLRDGSRSKRKIKILSIFIQVNLYFFKVKMRKKKLELRKAELDIRKQEAEEKRQSN